MALITLIGLTAGVFTTISFIPQVIKAVKSKQTRDLSLGMYVILTTGISLWLLYGILIRDIPVILANGISLVLAATILYTILSNR